MSYVVLARKWRPGGFDELIGQKTISTILKNAISEGRIGHAYLFSGPRGVGKTSTARILAKALNCTDGPTPYPCGRCDFCTAIAEGHSVDVMEIDGASNNSVDDIRDLRERVKYAPSAGRYKVYIIDEVHMLSQSAFNALLKTLEEPPLHVVFVLATTTPQKVPVTVLSRCQHLSFKRVPFDEMKGQIKRITTEEGIEITEQAVEMIVRAAEGSMRDALTLLDQLSAFSMQVTEAGIRDLLGLTDIDLIMKMTDALLNGDRKEIISLIDRLYDSGTDFRAFVRELLQFVRTLLVSKIIRSADGAELTDVEKDYMKRVIPSVTEEELTLLLSEVIKTESDVRNAFSPRVALEMGLIRASLLSSLKPVGEIIKRIQGLGGTSPLETETPAVLPPEPLDSQIDSQTDSTKGSVSAVPEKSADGPMDQAIWERILAKVDEQDPKLASMLKHAEPVLEADRLILSFNGGHSIHAESVEKNLKRLKLVLQDIGEGPFEPIKTIGVVKKESVIKSEKDARLQITPEEKKVMETFEGRIVEKRRIDV